MAECVIVGGASSCESGGGVENELFGGRLSVYGPHFRLRRHPPLTLPPPTVPPPSRYQGQVPGTAGGVAPVL